MLYPELNIIRISLIKPTWHFLSFSHGFDNSGLFYNPDPVQLIQWHNQQIIRYVDPGTKYPNLSHVFKWHPVFGIELHRLFHRQSGPQRIKLYKNPSD